MLTPSCSGGKIFCHGRCYNSATCPDPYGESSVTCNIGQMFCPYKEVCVTGPSINSTSCMPVTFTPPDLYTVREYFDVTVSSPGYQTMQLPSPVNVLK